MANSVGFFIHDVLCEIRGICEIRGEDVGGFGNVGNCD